MKRVWAALVILALAAALCVGEQINLRSFHGEMSEKITAAKVCLKNGDKEKYAQTLGDIKSCWKKRNDLLFMMSSHVALDELAAETLAVNPGMPTNELYELEARLNIFYENNRITLSNIF